MRASGPPPTLQDFQDDDNLMLPTMRTNGYEENLLFDKLRQLEEDDEFVGRPRNDNSGDDVLHIFEGNSVLKSLLQC